MTRPRRQLLLVAYYYPPLNITGARRPAALAKWLGRRGHEVTVLTSRLTGVGPDKTPEGTLRTRDLLTSRLNWRGKSLDAITGQSNAAWDPRPSVWGSISVPDVQLITWAPFATARAVRLQKRHNFDAVITTSPLESAHAVGLAMSACGVPWIADLRDGWRFEAPREEWPLRAQRLLDDAFERAVVRRADQVVTISEPLSEDLRRRYGIAVETITNGFDPEEFERLSRANDTPVAVDQRKLTLVHTGRLGAERTLRPMLEALARMASVDATLHRRVELVLAGAQTEQEQAMYADRRFAPFVRHVGFLSREQAMALQHAADVLLLVTTGARTGEATGKLFEYLAAGRPILVLGDGSAAANIVAGVGAGASIPVRDPGAARAALEAILAEGMPVPPPSARDAYSYPTLAARYEQVLEQAIARRHGA